jgi:hypothetical protein
MYQILKGLVYLHHKSISHRGKRIVLGYGFMARADGALTTDLKVTNLTFILHKTIR